MSDDPEGPADTRGGKELGDPALHGATETGRSGIAYRKTGDDDPDDASTDLPGEKGGAAGGGGQAGG